MVKAKTKKSLDKQERHKRFRAMLKEAAQKKGVELEQLDVVALVGEAAGDVYMALDGKGEVPIKELKDAVGKGLFSMAAIGWLMREGKISAKVTEETMTIALK